MSKVFGALSEYIDDLDIIDTHEHLPAREEDRDFDTDALKEYMQQYLKRDIQSAGLTDEALRKVHDLDRPLMERWAIVEPFWEACRITGYGRSLDIAVKELYGIPEINRDTIEELTERFKDSLSIGHYEKVLREKCRIRIGLLDQGNDLDCDRRYFRPIFRVDHMIIPKSWEILESIENRTGIRLCCFEDWLDACEKVLDDAVAGGSVGLKCALAYERSLDFPRGDRSRAEAVFNRILDMRRYLGYEIRSLEQSAEFENTMMHHILRLANRKKLTFQFHTGLQSGKGNHIANSDPALLSNLFLEYPDVRFDLFHMGYPYQQTTSALAKCFRNVYIDMCWAHIISPFASRRALSEFLDSVPASKICAFGGDYHIVDAVYGHQYLARLNVSRVLAEKVDEGTASLDRAKKIAKMLFYDNPARIYDLSDLE